MAQADLNKRGQKLSKQAVRVEQRAAVALLEDRREGESERRLRRKVTCGGVCVMSGARLRLSVRRNFSN